MLCLAPHGSGTAAPTCCHSHMHLYFSAPPSAVLHNLLWQKKQTNKKNPNSCQHICRAPVLPGPGWAVDYNPYFCLLLLASRHLGPSK